ncbi:MAG TPA: cytochrome c-type biogenesis protein [Longimicrobiales bacterium]|nr:cytochrome c-type biogenesis protein [Longimicrobiales bacterium]
MKTTRAPRIVATLLLGLIIQGIGGAADGAAAPQSAEQQRPGDGEATRGAADAALERRTSEVASGLRCPVCQGVSVEDSPTELARQMRGVVREQLAAGRTPDEVRAFFEDKYGEWILLEPKANGFNLVVYILPWLALLAGLGVIVIVVRRWTRPPPGEAPQPAQPVASSLEP